MLRTEERPPVDVEVTVTYKTTAPCLNISSGGLCLLLSRPLPEEIVVDVQFCLPNKKEVLICKARVLRCQRSKLRGDFWEIGVELEEPSDEVQMAIAEFVDANTAGSTAS